jgi:ABC-type nitrate/sulfonate/bicarbonate transport system ATPase subunit
MEGIGREERRQRAAELCRLIGLAPEVFLGKYPKELSGGEKRRVAIGMALAYEADLLLLDEPTSQLDYLSRWDLQQTILDIWSRKRFTAVLVTHDLDEAVYLSDRVLVLENSTSKAILRINLPRPRTPALRDSEDFRALKNHLIDYHHKARDADQSITAY